MLSANEQEGDMGMQELGEPELLSVAGGFDPVTVGFVAAAVVALAAFAWDWWTSR